MAGDLSYNGAELLNKGLMKTSLDMLYDIKKRKDVVIKHLFFQKNLYIFYAAKVSLDSIAIWKRRTNSCLPTGIGFVPAVGSFSAISES